MSAFHPFRTFEVSPAEAPSERSSISSEPLSVFVVLTSALMQCDPLRLCRTAFGHLLPPQTSNPGFANDQIVTKKREIRLIVGSDRPAFPFKT